MQVCDIHQRCVVFCLRNIVFLHLLCAVLYGYYHEGHGDQTQVPVDRLQVCHHGSYGIQIFLSLPGFFRFSHL